MSLSQKFFRKFYYENSGFIDSETVFFEITNPNLLNTNEVFAAQNVNKLSTLSNSRIEKVFNLDMEVKEFPKIDLSKYEIIYAK